MTDNFEKKVAVDGPVVNAGELGSSTFSPGQALPAGPLGLGQRWTVARKREVVLRLLRDEPQTNGVAERFNRTLKEQTIHGRIYRNIAELRDAVRDFVELYNAQWIVEKNGYLSPAQARQAWHAAISIRPAA